MKPTNLLAYMPPLRGGSGGGLYIGDHLLVGAAAE